MIRYALHLIERESNNAIRFPKDSELANEHYLEVLGFAMRNSYAKTASFCTLF